MNIGKEWSIHKKLNVGFGLVGLMLVILFMVNWLSFRSQANARNNMKLTEKIRFQMMQNRVALANYLLSGDGNELTKINNGRSKIGELAGEAQRESISENESSALKNVVDSEAKWFQDFATPLIEKRKQVDAGNVTVNELQVFYITQDPGYWVTKSSDIIDQVDKATNDALDSAANSMMFIAAFTALLTLVASVFIAKFTAQSITSPLVQLMTVTREISNSGDLDQKIDLDRKDEIGELASSFSNMISYLKEMAAVSEAIAGGDLTVAIEPRSKHDTLMLAFARMTDSLRAMVKTVRDSATQVASGSNQVADTSDNAAKVSVQASSAIDEVTSTMHEMSVNVQNMVKNTQTQAISVSETSASIDEMVASIQRVADTAKVLLDISQRSRDEVHQGISSMEKTTEGLNRINQSIQSAGEIIDALGKRADSIDNIVEVIDDLAEQTNLLALNAAIEAARAGEHGSGFAVVADEVRKLAEKSASSAKEISDLIASIQNEARQAVDKMEKSTGIVNQGLEFGNDLQSALKKISNVVTEVYRFAQEIGAATSEQSHGSTQIAKATTRLNEITHEINSSVEEQAAGAQAVVRAMEKMRELIAQTTSGSTELAASAEQMSKMSRNLLESMDRFVLELSRSANGTGHSRPHEETEAHYAMQRG